MDISIFCEVYEEYMSKNTYLGSVIPIVGINAPMSLKDYIKPHLLRFFKCKKINEGFFVISIKDGLLEQNKYEKKAFMIECELKAGIIVKMEMI